MHRIVLTLFFSGTLWKGAGQYQWKLQRQSDGIKIYVSDVLGSGYKAVKAECTFPGTYAELIAILTNVPGHTQWIYNAKTNYLLKQNNPLDLIYYTETHLPWPASNRDAVIHLRIRTDSLPRFLNITGTGLPKYIPEKSGKVRVPHYKASWRVSMPSPGKLHIVYVLEVDPGGSLPAWISNMFVEKGPFETFKKLGGMLGR